MEAAPESLAAPAPEEAKAAPGEATDALGPLASAVLVRFEAGPETRTKAAPEDFQEVPVRTKCLVALVPAPAGSAAVLDPAGSVPGSAPAGSALTPALAGSGPALAG